MPCCVHIDSVLHHTSPVCSTFCIHTWMKLWRHTCEGEWGRREWLGLVLGQNSIASWPIRTESASLSNMGRSVPELFPALVWNIERLIISGSGLNANLGTIIWSDLFVCSFSTFKLANTHSSRIPSSKSLKIVFLLGAGYAILFIKNNPCCSPGIYLLPFQYQNRVQLKL